MRVFYVVIKQTKSQYEVTLQITIRYYLFLILHEQIIESCLFGQCPWKQLFAMTNIDKKRQINFGSNFCLRPTF